MSSFSLIRDKLIGLAAKITFARENKLISLVMNIAFSDMVLMII